VDVAETSVAKLKKGGARSPVTSCRRALVSRRSAEPRSGGSTSPALRGTTRAAPRRWPTHRQGAPNQGAPLVITTLVGWCCRTAIAPVTSCCSPRACSNLPIEARSSSPGSRTTHGTAVRATRTAISFILVQTNGSGEQMRSIMTKLGAASPSERQMTPLVRSLLGK
jgi:hypothetical protein